MVTSAKTATVADLALDITAKNWRAKAVAALSKAVLFPELQKLLRNAIDSVIDVAAFNAEIDAYKRDAQFLAGVRRTVADALTGIDFGEIGGDA